MARDAVRHELDASGNFLERLHGRVFHFAVDAGYAATFGKSWKDRVTIIEGIDYAAAIESDTVGHSAAAVMLTGSATGPGRGSNVLHHLTAGPTM